MGFDDPIDSLWQRAFWQVAAEINRDGHQKSLHFKDVDTLVIEWAKLGFDEMVKRSEEYK